jgi:hypothetical protein
MTTYDVNVTREGRWWMVEIPALDGLTQARRLSEVEDMAASYIAVTLDVPLSSVELGRVHIEAGSVDASAVAAEISALRTQAVEAEARAGKLMRSTAEAMSHEGVPIRDIGEVLGVSYQRVGQLLNA